MFMSYDDSRNSKRHLMHKNNFDEKDMHSSHFSLTDCPSHGIIFTHAEDGGSQQHQRPV